VFAEPRVVRDHVVQPRARADVSSTSSTVSPATRPIRNSAVSVAGTVDAHEPASTVPQTTGHGTGNSRYRG